ncbi:MAG: hypothetical protein V3U54_07825 [Thermodesulfobacteriota bacterium]
MKIERHKLKKVKLKDFAEKHNLTLVISERPKWNWKVGRYTAQFKNVEVKEGSFLKSLYGDGENEENAVQDYISNISESTLVYDAYGKNRKVFEVPLLVP